MFKLYNEEIDLKKMEAWNTGELTRNHKIAQFGPLDESEDKPIWYLLMDIVPIRFGNTIQWLTRSKVITHLPL